MDKNINTEMVISNILDGLKQVISMIPPGTWIFVIIICLVGAWTKKHFK